MIQLQEFYDRYFPLIMERLRSSVHDSTSHRSVQEIVAHHFETPGKCLRSFLVINLAKCFSNLEHSSLLDFASSLELIHEASLIHDDLQDQDFYRRGGLNVWKKFSPSQAINIGDLLFTKALEKLLDTGVSAEIRIAVVKRMTCAINDLIQGQMHEIAFRDSMPMSRADWELIAAGKTGAIFRLAFEGSMMLSGIDCTRYQDELDKLGKMLGCLYQMRDDVLDVTGMKDGRKQGSDIIEGKMNYCSIILLEIDPALQSVLADALHGDISNELERITTILRLYASNDVVNKVKDGHSRLILECRNILLSKELLVCKPVIDNFLDMLLLPDSVLPLKVI